MPVFYPNSGFYISGENLDSVSKVRWGDVDIGREKILIDGTTGISGVMPPNAQTDIVFFVESDGTVTSLGEQQVRLKEVDQITVGSLNVTSGNANDIVPVTGKNFYRVTNVKFGNSEANFFLNSPSEIEAIVPFGAEYGSVTVYSSVRSGEDDVYGEKTFYNSGASPNSFTTLSEITSINPNQQIFGESITISGNSLSSVTGVRFPDSNIVNPASQVSNNSFTVEVPTGKTRGALTLLLEGGLSKTPSSTSNTFSHIALIDNVPSVVVGGNQILLQGRNFHTGLLFNQGNSLVKVDFSGVTVSGFKVISPTLIEGKVPSNLETGETLLSLFDEIGGIYPSGKTITVSGNLPVINKVRPDYGITGTIVNIEGRNLIGIKSVTLTSEKDSGNFAKITGSSITDSSLGDFTQVAIPTGLQSGYSSGEGRFALNVEVSGSFGVSNKLSSGYLIIGRPVIEQVSGGVDATRQPRESGALSGINLLRESRVQMFDSVDESSMGFVSVRNTFINASGDYEKVSFLFPESFSSTGVKLKVSNLGGVSNFSDSIPVFKEPEISGFAPASGVAGTSVLVSGYFSGLKEDTVKVGTVNVSNLIFNENTGLSFDFPPNATSDFINVETSGGTAQSKTRFSLQPDIPIITGFDPDANSPLDYSVFSKNQKIDILGSNLGLVNQVLFYDKNGFDTLLTSPDFSFRSSNKISVFLKDTAASEDVNNLYLSGNGGKIRLQDRFSRRVTGSQQFRIAEFSGTSSSYAAFGEELSFSGKFFSGLNATFKDESGINVPGEYQSTTTISNTGYTFSTKVPRDIVGSEILISGNNNKSIHTTTGQFFPLPTITGVSGVSDFSFGIGDNFQVTGVNSFGGFQSGDAVVGITGDGEHSFFGINSFSRAIDSSGEKVSVFDLNVGDNFTGSGQLFIMSPWEDYNSTNFSFPSSKTNENINKILTDDFYTIVYPQPIITGIATGNKFNERISGFISGNNLSPVTGVFFSGSGSGVLHQASSFKASSNTLLQFAPPFGAYGAIGDGSTGSALTGSGYLIVKSPQGDVTSEDSFGQIELIQPVSFDSFSPLEGITGSDVYLIDNLTAGLGGSLLHTSKVTFETVDHAGEADFVIDSRARVTATVPQFSIAEGQDALITIHGVLTDKVTSANVLSYYHPDNDRFTVVHDSPTVQFNVLSGRVAPEVGSSRSAIFTIVESIDGIDYYVTKMINPDGKEVIINTETT